LDFTSIEKFLPSRRHVGGGILFTEFIQICTMFVVDFDRQHHIHLNSLVFQTKFVSTGKCEKYRFHGESSQIGVSRRVDVFCSSRFEFPKVARPIRVPVRVTPCGRMPPRGPRAPPATVARENVVTSAHLRTETQKTAIWSPCQAYFLVTTDRSV